MRTAVFVLVSATWLWACSDGGGNAVDAICGDGVVDAGEACDPGAPGPRMCSATCAWVPSCGDGHLDTGEICDDGNLAAGDGCDANCQAEPPPPVCGDNTVAGSEECDDGNLAPGDGCDANCQAEPPPPVCGDNTVAGSEECDDGNLAPGDGCDANCQAESPPVCGDNTVAGSEECDDGNLAPGDGCDAACQREPACGDGFVDAPETCDDQNQQSNDGCRACQREAVAWRHVFPDQVSGMAFDSVRNRTVMWDGESLFYWDGTKLTSELARGGLPGRLVFDSVRDRLIVFPVNSQTVRAWEWNGTTWTEGTATGAPPGEVGMQPVFDAARGVVVAVAASGDVHEWNGTNWRRVQPATGPGARTNAAMAYDSARQRVVLFGGANFLTMYGDTWAWNGTSWTQLTSVGPARANAAMVFDALNDRLLLTGGNEDTFGLGLFATFNDTWQFKNNTWTQLTVEPNQSMIATYDRTRNVAVSWNYTGTFGPLTEFAADWAVRQARVVGPETYGYCWWDPARRNFLVAGSSYTTFDGVTITPVASPGTIQSGRLVVDPVRNEIVLFGGIEDNSTGLRSNQTWLWNGTAWRRAAEGATSPPRLSGAAMAWDSKRNRVLLFGGSNGSVALDETWAWDGAVWTQLTPTTRATARANAMMAYDAKRDRMVLFGGGDPETMSALTSHWEFDGTTWQLIAASTPLGAGSFGFAFYNAPSGRLLYHGRWGSAAALETWSYDGIAWQLESSGAAVPDHRQAAWCGAYDPQANAATVLVQGQTSWQLTFR